MNDLANYVQSNIISNEECTIHNLPIIYYCKNCKISLCSDCVMLNDEHKNHIINKVDSLYKENLSSLNKMISNYNKKINQYSTMMKSIEQIVESVDDFIENKNKEIKEMYDEMRRSIQEKGDEIKEKLIHCKEGMKMKIDQIKAINIMLNKKISSLGKTEMIKQYKEIILENTVNDKIDNEIYERIYNMNISFEISKEIQPQYEQYAFCLFDIRAKEYQKIYDYYAMKFLIKVSVVSNNLNVFIELKDGISKNEPMSFIVEMMNWKNMNYQSSYSKENTYSFRKREVIGYSKFAFTDKLTKEGYINKKGLIKLRIGLKPITYKALKTIIEEYYMKKTNTKLLKKSNSTKDIHKRLNLNEEQIKKEERNLNEKKIIDFSQLKNSSFKESSCNLLEKEDINDLSLSSIQNNTKVFYNETISLTLDNYEDKKNIHNISSMNSNLYPKNSLNKILNKNNITGYLNTIMTKPRNSSSNVCMVYPENKFNFIKKP